MLKLGDGCVWNEPATPPQINLCQFLHPALSEPRKHSLLVQNLWALWLAQHGLNIYSSTDADYQGSKVSRHLFLLSSSESPPTRSPYLEAMGFAAQQPFAKLVQLANLEVEARLKLIFVKLVNLGGWEEME